MPEVAISRLSGPSTDTNPVVSTFEADQIPLIADVLAMINEHTRHTESWAYKVDGGPIIVPSLANPPPPPQPSRV